MTRCVLLLRGLNVGRANRIRMPELVAVVEQACAADVTTHLQSGNVLVSTDDAGALAGRVEALLAEQGVRSPVLWRTASELDTVVAADPFVGRDLDPKLVHVAFLSAEPDPDAVADIDAAALLPEEVVVRGREAYLWYARGVQGTRLDPVLRRLGRTATARNWRTTLALRDLLDAG